MGSIIAFANQKGGVGKTTTTANLGVFVAGLNKKVLLVDFDSQANLTSTFGLEKNQPGVYEILTGKASVDTLCQKTGIENLSIITSNINLTGASVELVNQPEREFFLKKALFRLRNQWDYIFIDCPPSLGILTLNGLTAADYVIIPLQCEYFALEGLSMLVQSVKMVQQKLNASIKMGGIVFTMYDQRIKISQEVVSQVSGYFKDKVFKSIIPRSVRLTEAPSHGKAIAEYAPNSPGAIAYQNLAKEVVERV